MLLQRIITASILATLITLAVFWLPAEYFPMVLGIIVLAAAWEWLKLVQVNPAGPGLIFPPRYTKPAEIAPRNKCPSWK